MNDRFSCGRETAVGKLKVRAGLTVKEIHVKMLPRTEGKSFITPVGSAFYLFKTLIVLLVGQLRPKDTVEAKE